MPGVLSTTKFCGSCLKEAKGGTPPTPGRDHRRVEEAGFSDFLTGKLTFNIEWSILF